jgi:hypothetical protein
VSRFFCWINGAAIAWCLQAAIFTHDHIVNALLCAINISLLWSMWFQSVKTRGNS